MTLFLKLCVRYVRKCFRICHFMPFNEHVCPRRLAELQENIFLAHFTCHETWKRRNKSSREMPERVVLMKKWWVCFWQALKRSRQMACSVWALASVTDQGEWGTEGRENRNRNKLFHCHANQPAVNASNSMIGDWDARAVRPHFIWNVWLIDSPPVRRARACILSLLHSFINPVQYLPVTPPTVAPFPIDCAIDLIDGWSCLLQI